jgi:CRP-like cAMP-binding protein
VVESIIYLLKPVSYKAGATIFNIGEDTNYVMLLNEGEVETYVSSRGLRKVKIAGKDQTLDILKVGSTLCQFGVLSDEDTT